MVGVKHTTAMMGQMIYTAVPLITIIFAYILSEEIITRKKIAGVTIGLIGGLIIVLQPIAGREIVGNASITGNLIIFTGMSTFALYSVLIKKHQSNHSPFELNFYFMVTAFFVQLILLPIDLINEPAWWHTITMSEILGILYVGAIGTGIYYLLLQYSLKTSSALGASTMLYIQPLFAFLWANALLGEQLTFDLILGGMLAFLGIGLVISRQKAIQTLQ